MASAAVVCAQNSSAVETQAAYSQGSVVASGKARIWIGYDTDSPFYSGGDEMKLWIHQAQSSTGTGEHVYTLSANGGSFNNSAENKRRYDYFDINVEDYTNTWYLTVQRFKEGYWQAATDSFQLVAADAFKIYYIWSNGSTVSTGSIGSVDAGLAAKALAGIQTCNSSSINGYGAFANFNSTFVKNGSTWKTVGNLGDYELTDYYSGSPSVTVNAYTKYQAVENMSKTGKISGAYNVAPFVAEGTNNIALIAGIASLGLAACGAMIFLAKRRKEI